MTFEKMQSSVTQQSSFQKHDLLLVFFFFMIGSVCVTLGRLIAPWIIHEAEGQFTVLLSLLPAAIALLAGSTVWGLYLIPASAVVQGAAATLSAYRFIGSATVSDLISSEMLSAIFAVPAFFLMGVLGLSNASSLLYALRLSGKSAVRTAMRSFVARWVIFAALLLCFFFSHGTINR